MSSRSLLRLYDGCHDVNSDIIETSSCTTCVLCHRPSSPLNDFGLTPCARSCCVSLFKAELLASSGSYY